jgi:hypothetical protein
MDRLYVGGYFPFSYLENGSIKIARSLGVRAAGGETKMVTVIKNWKMVESSVEEGPNVPENAGKMVNPQYRLTLRYLRSAALTRTGKLLEHCHLRRSSGTHCRSARAGAVLQRCRVEAAHPLPA